MFDRFFVNAEVSADGHNWSTAAYATDYVEKTMPSHYSGRGRTYDYEGTNRGRIPGTRVPDDDVAEPANGYLWNLARSKPGSHSEITASSSSRPGVDPATRRPGIAGRSRSWRRTRIPDSQASTWTSRTSGGPTSGSRSWRSSAGGGRCLRLQIVRLPNDHTAGAKVGSPTPRAFMADNDLALGRMVEALSQLAVLAQHGDVRAGGRRAGRPRPRGLAPRPRCW